VPRTAPPPRRSPLLPFYAVLAVVALVGGVLLFRQLSGPGGAAATTLERVVLTPEQLNRVPGIAQGSPDAPVVVMEFADFQCPACAQFARFSKPLVADHVRNGNVRFIWYDFPLVQIHEHAMLAARAGRCANEQGRFWEYHDLLFGTQSEWSAVRGGRAVDLFLGYGERAGLDRSAFSSCLRSDRFQQEVSENYEFGTALNVSGTPTLFVNGRRLDRIPTNRAGWDALVQQEMGGAPMDAPGGGEGEG
jgi:protein-disulfide isomerase